MRRAVQVGAFLILLSILLVGVQFAPVRQPTPITITPTRMIEIGGVQVRVAMADTNALRQNGLSFYDYLEADQGMLFVFEADGIYPFWMKDMLFAIDILWLDAAGKVVHIEKNISPETYPASFTPDSPARYVLEVPAGFADQHDIQIGATANLEE